MAESAMIWAWLAALAAVLVEVLYRQFPRLPWSWWLSLMFPVALLINFAIWKLMTTSSSLIGGVVAFSIAIGVLRVVASLWYLGEAPEWQDWAGFGLVMLAAVVRGL